jgi:hypothetical protein
MVRVAVGQVVFDASDELEQLKRGNRRKIFFILECEDESHKRSEKNWVEGGEAKREEGNILYY